MEQFLGGLQVLLQWQNFLIIPVGLAIGIIVGAIPGLTSDLGLILCIPLTYGMDPTMAILMLLAIYCGGTYGGSITAILINTPGTSANAATLFDGYPMTQRGQAFKALQMALYASTIGGLISAFALLFLAHQIAKITLLFGPAEYFALAVFGLSVIAGVSNNSIFKGLIGACIGLFMATIGMDNISGTARFTFGSNRLMSGIDLIIALIGLFAISEIMMKSQYDPRTDHKTISSSAITRDKITKDEYRRCRKPIGIGSLIGVIIGATPGTGGGLAAFISYNQVKQSSSHPETFGHGEIEGVAASESANNGACGATMIPMLTLGIPGESVTAVLMGGLIIQGLQPGPELFTRYAPMTYTFFAGFVLVQFFMLGIGLLGCRGFAQISRLSDAILIPSVAVLCVVGSFAIHKNFFDVVIMMIFGVLGYLVRKFDLNPAAIVLALILGPIGENGLRRSLRLSGGSPAILFSTPLCWVLIALCVFGVCSPIFMNRMEKKAVEDAGGDIPNETGDDPVRTSD